MSTSPTCSCVPIQLDRVQDDEQRLPVLLDFRALMPVAGIVDRQLVQSELLLHRGQLGVVRLVQRDPHEAARPLEMLADVLAVDVGDFLPFLIGDAIDQHAFSPGSWLGAGRGKRGPREHSSIPARTPRLQADVVALVLHLAYVAS